MTQVLSTLKRRLRTAVNALRGQASQEEMKVAFERATAHISKAVSEEVRHLDAVQAKRLGRLDDRLDALRKRIDELERPIRSLDEQHAALRIAVRGLASAVSAGSEAVRGPVMPVSAKDDHPPPAGTPSGASVTMLDVRQCPMCAHVNRTPVCEYNRLILLDTDTDEAVKRYDYSMCHACGLVYATHRPCGPTLTDLMLRFDDNLGRSQRPRTTPHAVLNPLPLTDKDRNALRSRAARGVFVSEHLGLPVTSYLSGAQRDRLANSAHVELLGSLLDLKGARVLELRPRLGSILAGLQRLHGADVYALPLFESQQFLIEELYGIKSPHLLNLDEFEVPFEGTFDLIVANHVFTHAVRPGDLFRCLRSRLRPGGHVYLYNEGEDAEFLKEGKSMINTLNPFHLQAFDGAVLSRSLAAIGLETVFSGHHDGLVCLLRAGPPAPPQMDPGELTNRISQYLRARDSAILRLPESERGRYKSEWSAVLERAVAAGVAQIDDKGRLRLSR